MGLARAPLERLKCVPRDVGPTSPKSLDDTCREASSASNVLIKRCLSSYIFISTSIFSLAVFEGAYLYEGAPAIGTCLELTIVSFNQAGRPGSHTHVIGGTRHITVDTRMS